MFSGFVAGGERKTIVDLCMVVPLDKVGFQLQKPVLRTEHDRKLSQMNTTAQASPRLVLLIQEAAKRAGNEAKLGELIEETRHNVNAWKHGKRSCPLEAQILMAAIAERDVGAEIKAAVLERNAGTSRGEKLIYALGKGVFLTGVVIASTLSANGVLATDFWHIPRCILCKVPNANSAIEFIASSARHLSATALFC